MTWFALLLAATPPAGSAPGGAGTTAPPGGAEALGGLLIPLVLAMAVFYFFMWRGQKKERNQHDTMIASLKRNDRVQTVGGIIGTVVDVRDNEVVLKVDESSNVKVRFLRSAIRGRIGEAAAPAEPEKK